MANEETSGVAALKGKRRKNQLRRKGGGRRELEQGPMMETRRGKGFPGAERAGGQRQAVGLGVVKVARGELGIEAGCFNIRQTDIRHVFMPQGAF